MNGKEILIVTRCFWPQCGLKELAISDLAMNLQSAGHRVTIATVRWIKQWSEHIEYHGIPVVRFAKPVSGPWSSFRYGRLLAKHLGTKTYDAIIACGVGDETAATIRCVDELTPTIIYLDAGWAGSVGTVQRKQLDCLLSADAIVTNDRQTAEMLEDIEGIPDIHVIRNGIRNAIQSAERPLRKRQAREALSAAHPILQIEPNQRLAVTYTPFDRGSGLAQLVRAWPQVLSRFPRAKLWLLGDGPDSPTIWHQISSSEIAHSVIMPGFFDNLHDIFAAADLYIHPSSNSDCGDGLIRAIAAGLNFVSAGHGELNRVADCKIDNSLAHSSDWSRAILDQFIEPCLSNVGNLDDGLKEVVSRCFCPAQQIDQLLKIIDSATVNQVAIAK